MPELTGIIAGLKDAEGRALTAIPAAQLDQGIAIARQMMASAVITPAECGALASNAQIPLGSTYAAGRSQPAKEKAITVLTLVAVTDPELLDKGVEASLANGTKCSSFTTELQNQRITSKTEVLNVKTAGDKSFGSLSTQTMPSGQTMTTVVVMGIKGTLSASAVVVGTGLTAAASADLARLVDEALREGLTPGTRVTTRPSGPPDRPQADPRWRSRAGATRSWRRAVELGRELPAQLRVPIPCRRCG